MTDELFQAYKAKASELLKAKVPFGEHQRDGLLRLLWKLRLLG